MEAYQYEQAAKEFAARALTLSAERDEALRRANSLEKKLVASINQNSTLLQLLQRYYELHFQRDLHAFVLSGCSLCQQARQLLGETETK